MSSAFALGRDLAQLEAEIRALREDIDFLTIARDVNPQAIDRAIETRRARIFECGERMEIVRFDALRMSLDR